MSSPFDDEGRDRRNRVSDRHQADDDIDDGENAGRVGQRINLTVADRADRDDRHIDGIEQRPAGPPKVGPPKYMKPATPTARTTRKMLMDKKMRRLAFIGTAAPQSIYHRSGRKKTKGDRAPIGGEVIVSDTVFDGVHRTAVPEKKRASGLLFQRYVFWAQAASSSWSFPLCAAPSSLAEKKWGAGS